MTKPKLKACPNCKKQSGRVYRNAKNHWVAFCNEPHCFFAGYFATEDKAIEAWNKGLIKEGA